MLLAKHQCGGRAACQSIDALVLGSNIDFDLDLVVVTRKNQHPSVSRIALGDRTIFEKRFFRERQGKL